MRPRQASDAQLTEMRHCHHSVVEAASDLTPVYLCGKDWTGSRNPTLPLCVLYTAPYCEERE